MISDELKTLIHLFSKLPGLGPRSGKRIALHLLQHRTTTLPALAESLQLAGVKVKDCSRCGNLDSQDPCGLCQDSRRDQSLICVVESVADLWALERSASFKGQYHVLGGVLSALDGVGPKDIRLASLLQRCQKEKVQEVILALNATVEGQTTSHYITERLKEVVVLQVTSLARGVPLGGELDYLDEGTLSAALLSRRSV
ncbi:MAG: Recombination protein RecR [uncultured bacterium]|nr:MAG: Recombination protein RecR [uncultured bacterium]OFW69980.1 MAG: recombination protein RecR [Alphaproteobacteria bacterium GWC2_42_16]OFW74458.1 MAG: recombination protein RecR [Alphaproteobacteria bacterium GWA2_41_27]OFW84812.1 MAG: recombination protein RecR [Alphaproteobacteria bacterium RIFCSPHIGHO2_12_FULL_42_100]OFW86675.1 MAG: recombination protein RecR [Alphaproteobacteria bacterium RBG_16_42_14]OFW90687.1 MAG: recombination protein RecR [Alphaproteobacteria bacterium RIFCSPHI